MKVPVRHLFLILFLATTLAGPLHAAPRTTDLPSAFGGSLRVWHDAGAIRPWATVILFAGGNGAVGLGDDATFRSLGGNFLVRTRQNWLAQGLAVLIPDAPSGLGELRDQRAAPEHAADIAMMVRLAGQLHPGTPIWLVGTSNGSISAANGAARLPRGDIAGVVLSSSVTRRGRQAPQSATMFSVPLATITVPALVVAHQQDGCFASPAAEAPSLRAALTSARRSEMLVFDGGQPGRSGPCEAASPHGYLGIEADVIGRIVEWMRR